jgi:hypothetical protein
VQFLRHVERYFREWLHRDAMTVARGLLAGRTQAEIAAAFALEEHGTDDPKGCGCAQRAVDRSLALIESAKRRRLKKRRTRREIKRSPVEKIAWFDRALRQYLGLTRRTRPRRRKPPI